MSRAFRWLWILVMVVLALQASRRVLPSATLIYPDSAAQPVRVIWNIQDRIYKARLRAGQSSTEYGRLLPQEDFFMRVDWWGSEGRGCAVVTPSWKGTRIYLTRQGDIDRSEGNLNDWTLIAQCPEDRLPPTY